MKIRNVALGVHIATLVIALGLYFPAINNTSTSSATMQMAIVYCKGYLLASFLSGLVATFTTTIERDLCLLVVTTFLAFFALI